jgi:(R,R)-butanediol dehydrogenase / meso-butanediol dehydrogenase / diacetyl reductase
MIVDAAVYTGARTVRIEGVPSVAPGPGEAQIEVAYTGICGTDLHVFRGDMDARVGRRAVLGIDAAGLMQGRWTVPAGTLVRIPPEVPLPEAALVEPVAVAVHDVRRAGLRPREKGCGRRRRPGRPAHRRSRCRHRRRRRGGGAETAPAAGGRGPGPGRRRSGHPADVQDVVQGWTSGAGADVAFEVSGVQAGVDTAVEALTARGRLVLVAIHTVRRPLDLHRFFWRELTLIGARLYTRDDFKRAGTNLRRLT